ncbi:MAG: transposase, partial [Gemmataceae bacterium]|nr:transposase [Gemmataceae bacterium]
SATQAPLPPQLRFASRTLTFWFDEVVLAAWRHENAERKVGRPFVYSDQAIESLLMLRELFRLPYTLSSGFVFVCVPPVPIGDG